MNKKQAKRHKKRKERQQRQELVQQRSIAKSTDDLLRSLKPGDLPYVIATLATEASPQGKKIYQELKHRIMNGTPHPDKPGMWLI